MELRHVPCGGHFDQDLLQVASHHVWIRNEIVDLPIVLLKAQFPASWRKLTKQWNQALSIDVDPATP